MHDLNADPRLPFADDSFDDVVCCVSVDYLVQPVEVFRDVARVLRPGGRFVCTFSNRCFPTKAIRGWLYASDERAACDIVAEYFRSSPAADPEEPVVRDEPHVEAPGTERRRPPVGGLGPVGRLAPPMKAFQRGVLVAAIAVAVSVVVRVRGKGRVPPTTGGWRELQGPDFR